MKLFKWKKGRQNTGYEKMLLASARWPKPFDVYLLRFFEGHEILPHRDKVEQGEHHRINLILKSAANGGDFICADPIYDSKYIKYFRPDISEHQVSKITSGSRYVLSLGWINNKQ